LEILKGRDYSEDLDVDGRVGKVWAGSVWLRIGTSGWQSDC
jgi:hypothetical protein